MSTSGAPCERVTLTIGVSLTVTSTAPEETAVQLVSCAFCAVTLHVPAEVAPATYRFHRLMHDRE